MAYPTYLVHIGSYTVFKPDFDLLWYMMAYDTGLSTTAQRLNICSWAQSCMYRVGKERLFKLIKEENILQII